MNKIATAVDVAPRVAGYGGSRKPAGRADASLPVTTAVGGGVAPPTPSTGAHWLSLVRQLFAWLVSGLLCFVFLGAGGAKLAAQPMMIAQFQSFGYPMWFMYVTGAIEFTAAILVMIPRTSRAAAVALACVMAGAICSLAIHGPHEHIAGPVVLLGLAASAFLLRRA